jgi:hypothetical protein
MRWWRPQFGKHTYEKPKTPLKPRAIRKHIVARILGIFLPENFASLCCREVEHFAGKQSFSASPFEALPAWPEDKHRDKDVRVKDSLGFFHHAMLFMRLFFLLLAITAGS